MSIKTHHLHECAILIYARLRYIELTQGNDDRDLFYVYLNQALPIIVFVNTAELKSYWFVPTFHAVVVTGLDDEFVYINDPFFAEAPKEVQREEFLLAWLEQDYWYAVIRLVNF